MNTRASRTSTSVLAVLLVGGTLVLPTIRPAQAEHFDIGLILRTSRGLAESGWDTYPPEGGLNPRQVTTAKAGENLNLEWRIRSEFPHGILKNVTIRVFVVREDTIGQKKEPPHDAPRVLDNTITADFLSHHTARGLLNFRITEPGNYLVRLENSATFAEHGHDHFGALDLKVE